MSNNDVRHNEMTDVSLCAIGACDVQDARSHARSCYVTRTEHEVSTKGASLDSTFVCTVFAYVTLTSVT